MDQSRRAVESYWRSRMIDGATSDEDKVTPVYKLEEICELLRSSHVSIVKEISEFILKRLQHKSPIVKQKALRVIKYAVGKSGAEFRREMQRNSVSVRQLIHYKGQPDPLKGDALNKAVRETAQEALSAIFSSDDNKPAPTETLGGRIQGFGNTNFEMPSEDKRSFLGEVVGIGSATIKQGLSTLTQSPSLKKNDTGSYRSPNLRRSLTTETDSSDRYEGMSSQSETYSSSRLSQNAGSGNWSQGLRTSQMETIDEDSSSSFGKKSREERLLETIVTSGGVRLQPTRDALQVFLVEASKLDALALSHALQSKLQSPQWQVRMRAVCVLEAVLRKKDDEHFSSVASYFGENKDDVVKCSESPQASLREKASKVLNLLDGEQSSEGVVRQEKPVNSEVPATQMPDLIDTGDSDNIFGTEESIQSTSNQSTVNPETSAGLIDDLFSDSFSTGVGSIEQKNEDDDPFADVSFHTGNDKEHEADLFSGMTVDKSGITTDGHMIGTSSEHQLFDAFGSSSGVPQEQSIAKRDVNDLMAGLSMNGNDSFTNKNRASTGTHSESIFPDATVVPNYQVSSEPMNNLSASQTAGKNGNQMFPLSAVPYNIPPGFMINPAFASQPINYSAMGSLLAQQQFLARMSNFQQLGNLNVSATADNATGFNGSYASPLPDIFNPGMAAQAPTSMMNNSKKEETKAFDFISDHLASARGPKRVV